MAQAKTFKRYNVTWDTYDWDDLQVELYCIRKGGKWKKGTKECGNGLFYHFMECRRLLWPERYRHRWTDLIYTEYLKNIVTILMGPGSSQKTAGGCECVLIDWLSQPDDTLVYLSTTTVQKLDGAVLGEMKMLHALGKKQFPWIPGKVVDSKHAIFTDDLDEKETRDERKGILGKACYQGPRYIGLGTLSGGKQKRIRFLADELQFMPSTFFDCLPNLFQCTDLDELGDPDVKVVGSGNPKHDPTDQLSIAAEPKNGWGSLGDITKTTVWETNFHRGVCVNLVGTDSPNFDVPEGVRPPYARLISRNSMKLVEKRWGKNSMAYHTQCLGIMMMNMVGNRVITQELCNQHHAFEKVVWKGNPLTRIGFLDPAWGGGDRCVWGWLEFGEDIDGKQIIRFGEYKIVPFATHSAIAPDEQIGMFVRDNARLMDIQPENIFYDSSGRGTIGAAMAKVFGFRIPVPIYFGDNATKRPVRHDLFVTEENGTERLKRCDEEYRKFVTELWFSVRNVIECGQMRELPEDVAREGYMREYMPAPGDRIEVEPKDETRERMGMSPDLFDALVCGVEGARQRGFEIGRVGEGVIVEGKQEDTDWFETESKAYDEAIKGQLLKHV